MAKKQTDRLRVEKIRGEGPKEIFGENAQKHDKSVNSFSKVVFETLKKLQSEGYRLILWTYRHGKTLEEAIEFCRKNGIEFYAVNSSFEGEVFDSETQSRKIDADLFIDDRNLGGFPGWGEIYNIINERIEFRVDGGEVLAYVW